MELLLPIAIISGIFLSIGLIFSLIAGIGGGKDVAPGFSIGIVFVISVWRFSLTLAILGIVFTAVAFIIRLMIFSKEID